MRTALIILLAPAHVLGRLQTLPVHAEQPGRTGARVRARARVRRRLDDGLGQGQAVAHHGAVQAVLGHDRRVAPGLLGLAPLGAPVLEPHLDAVLGQVGPGGEEFARVHVRVVGLFEGLLQLVDLQAREDCSEEEGGARVKKVISFRVLERLFFFMFVCKEITDKKFKF